MIEMEIKPLMKGAAAGAAVGTVCYVISKSSDRQKKSLKRNTGKAIKAFGSVVEGFSDMMG